MPFSALPRGNLPSSAEDLELDLLETSGWTRDLTREVVSSRAARPRSSTG